jgi:sporulation protein YlmC with PRC-barrel domain
MPRSTPVERNGLGADARPQRADPPARRSLTGIRITRFPVHRRRARERTLILPWPRRHPAPRRPDNPAGLNGGSSMRKLLWVALSVVAGLAPIPTAAAQVAGGATIGVTVEEMRVVVLGWSAKRKLLGHDVYNERNQKIGKIDDIIVSPKRTVSHAIIGVGVFLGLVKKDVAIPMDQLQLVNNRFILRGATKEALLALPEFQYAP